jgi:glycosyltransferase involved in cell wall biosynthesis
MKHFRLLSLFLFSFVFFSQVVAGNINFQDKHEFLLTVVIMVKDEANVIIPTLQPFVDAGLTSFLVYDTGSTDGTQKIVREYFNNHDIKHAYVVEEAFVDFATSRNRALDLAEHIFVNTTFMIMLDAEWYTHNVAELIDFCKTHQNYIAPHCTGSCYLMRLLTVQDNINNYTPRLFRRGYNVRYHGVVHESVAEASSGMLPDSVYFEYKPQQYGREKSKARFARDYALLKKSLEDDPTNMRTPFYLAQTCQFMDDWEQAIFYYQKRLDMGELSEEKYLAAYRIGCAIEHIIAEAYKNGSPLLYTEEDALNYYLKAYNMLPCRAEPLFRIACYYIRHNQHAIAYLFAIRAAQLPYPSHNTLFVENRVYDYLRYDILGQCALYVGEYAIGKAAVMMALQTGSEDTHLHHHLSLYERCMA